MRINWRKWGALFGIYSGSLILLFQFQNCAPAGSMGAGAASSTGSPTGEVRIVDDWNTQKVSLMAPATTASVGATSIHVDGLCDRHMDASSPLSWEVREPSGSGNLILAGTVDCQLGGFRVMISDLSELVCNRAYAFEVYTVDGDSAQAVLMRSCSM